MQGQLRRVMLALGPALLFVIASGCAGPPPTEALASADTMVKRAEQAGAGQFAPLPLRQAREKLTKAQREVEDSEYDEARVLAEQAELDAQLAATETERAKVAEAVSELSRTIDEMQADLGMQPGSSTLPPVSSPGTLSTPPSMAPPTSSPVTAPRPEAPR